MRGVSLDDNLSIASQFVNNQTRAENSEMNATQECRTSCSTMNCAGPLVSRVCEEFVLIYYMVRPAQSG